MSDKFRVTYHHGRAGGKGVYLPQHNDRAEIKSSDHIYLDRSADNWYWNCYQDNTMTFEQAEIKFYEEHFRQALDDHNDRAIKARHMERVKTMADYRKSKRTCPEETIIQIGCKGHTVDPKLLQQIVVEQINWETKRFPQCKILDVALHVDEATPHIHRRCVWIAHDDTGHETVSQRRALDEMGILEPDLTEACGRHNNAKMTYTKLCRDHLMGLCIEHGLEIEVVPREHSKSGRAIEEYKAQQEVARAQQALADAEQAYQDMKSALLVLQQTQQKLEQIQQNISMAKAKYDQLATQGADWILERAEQILRDRERKRRDDATHMR